MRLFGERKSVTFRNGVTFRLDNSQYAILRDNYALMHEYAFEQLAEDSFRIKKDSFELVSSLRTVVTVGKLRRNYSVEQIDEDAFKIKNEEIELAGSSILLHFFGNELEQGMYNCDCLNKVVLDVGGFEGETAVFFASRGAKKVIVYEPVEEHHVFIRQNISANNVNAEIYEEGIGDEDGVQIISYGVDQGDYGVIAKGSHEREIRVKAVTTVIQESGAHIAKFDCEGAEMSLLKVSSEILRQIELYMIEVHTLEIRKAIIEKFTSCGYSIERDTKGSPTSVLFFRRA